MVYVVEVEVEAPDEELAKRYVRHGYVHSIVKIFTRHVDTDKKKKTSKDK